MKSAVTPRVIPAEGLSPFDFFFFVAHSSSSQEATKEIAGGSKN